MVKQKALFNKLFIILIFFFCVWTGTGDTITPPVVINHTRDDYKAASQNWSVCQDSRGMVYVANSNGLLEYDGNVWTLYPSPDGNVIRAVNCDANGRIYTSGYRELGYWLRNPFGKLEYHSLTSLADSLFKANVEFWKIEILGEKVIFQAFTQLLIFENGKMTVLNFRSFVNSFFMLEGRMVFNVLNNGIYEYAGNEQRPFLTGEIFRDVIVRFMLPFGSGTYLIGTDSHGIFISDHGVVKQWDTPLNDLFKKNRINRGCFNPSGDVVVGTILDGVYLLNRNGKLKWKLNAETGLQNNTILGILADQSGNLWLALDQGIDMVLTSGFGGWTFVPAENIGAVYSAALFSDSIYLGTNQGLFVGKMNGRNHKYRLIPGTQGQVWDVRVIGNHVIAGHNSGTFLISGGKAVYLSRISGAFSITRDVGEEDGFLQCTYSNLVKYKLENGVLKQNRVFYNFNELIRFVETDHLGNIWLAHMHRGLFQLRYNAGRDSVRLKRYVDSFTQDEMRPNLRVFKINERVVFTSGKGLYTYDDLHDTIIPFVTLNMKLGKFSTATRIIHSGDNHYWFITEQSLGLLKISETEVRLLKEYPRELFGSRLIHQYENIIPLTLYTAVLCMENGYALLDGSTPSPECSFCEKAPYPGEIFLTSKKGKILPLPAGSKSIKIAFENHNLTVRWAFPHFPEHKLKFWWFLEGISADWAMKENSRSVSFERLPSGKYQLKVKVSDIWGHESRIHSLPVVVQPPWYGTVAAKVIFSLIFLCLLILFRQAIIRKIKKDEERKREENERELVKLKNEKLQAEIAFKIKELGSSTMMIIQKNKILSDLKELLQKQKSFQNSSFSGKNFGEIMRNIENTLSSHDDWKTFEITFDEAHESFMKNLKKRYPELSPKDIRLCAFLRMNLPSKEIAPLLGISVRGVENHRYRLRRKMNLEHDENLIEVILSL